MALNLRKNKIFTSVFILVASVVNVSLDVVVPGLLLRDDLNLSVNCFKYAKGRVFFIFVKPNKSI